MDANELEEVTCCNCQRPFKFPKGTIRAEVKGSFRCTSCATSTLEANVETHKNAGKKLLIEG